MEADRVGPVRLRVRFLILISSVKSYYIYWPGRVADDSPVKMPASRIPATIAPPSLSFAKLPRHSEVPLPLSLDEPGLITPLGRSTPSKHSAVCFSPALEFTSVLQIPAVPTFKIPRDIP